MKTYTIQKLIELHEKQAYILKLMLGERGQMLVLLNGMFMENQERIFHLLKITDEYPQTTADISRS